MLNKLVIFAFILSFANFAHAEDALNFNDFIGGNFSSKVLQLIIITTVLSLAPSILVMITSFTRIVIVLSFVRSAVGTQQTPPNPVIISLALFLTLFIMMPVFQESYDQGISLLLEDKIEESEALSKAAKPFHKFMREHTREKDLELFLTLSQNDQDIKPEEMPYQVLIPSFMISELRRAFEIGFLIFIPFIIIDMLVSSILMAMGMMMLPPAMIALPFKLIYFVVTDGWYMICGSLVRSYSL
jgi:flagellar biosynthetic protein FliP